MFFLIADELKCIDLSKEKLNQILLISIELESRKEVIADYRETGNCDALPKKYGIPKSSFN